jgi:hypothetical protein
MRIASGLRAQTHGSLDAMFTATEVFLVARRHVDYRRVCSAVCRQHR